MNRKVFLLGLLFSFFIALQGYGQGLYGSYYVRFKGKDKSYPALKAARKISVDSRVVESGLLLRELPEKSLPNCKLRNKAFSLHVGNALENCYQVSFEGIENEEQDDSVFAALRSLPGVESVERATTMEIMDTGNNLPNDPLLHLNKITGGWHLSHVGFEKIYGKYHGSPDVRVAIIDNAVWGEHPDLQIKPENQYFAYIEETGNSAPPSSVSQDYQCDKMYGCESAEWSHGTHCAGLVGALTDNNEGIASFASGVTLLAARSSDTEPRKMNRAMECLLWAVDNGADILSLSWGSANPNQTEMEIIKNVLKQGVVIIAAAGNNSNDVKVYPAAVDGVISVASVDSDNKISGFSTYGDWVDIAAPGGYLKDAEGNITPTSDMILSTTYSVSQQYHLDGLNEIDGLYYDGKVGTSMATPLVSSVVALMLSVNPSLTSAEILNILKTTSTKVDGLPVSSGGGVIDAAAAVEKAAETSGISSKTVSSHKSVRADVTNGVLTIRGAEDASGVSVFDAQGKMVYSGKNTEKINVSFLSKGVYVLHVEFPGDSETLKFVR